MGPMLFSIAIYGLVSNLELEFKVFFLDDGTMGGNLAILSADLKRIEENGNGSMKMAQSQN